MTTTKAKQIPEASMLKPSATFPNVDELEVEILKTKVARWGTFAWETKLTTQFISEPGVGKTSFVKDYFKHHLGLNVLSLHLPTVDPDRLSVAMPEQTEDGGTVLSPSVMSQLLEADVILLDESRRAKESVRNSMMEMVQNKTIGGTPLKDGVTFIVCNNWSNESGVMSSGRDLAQESRFKTIELKARDLPWQVALGSTFPDIDLKELFKVYNTLDTRFPGASKYVSPRTLEHIIWNIINDLPGEFGLPLMAGPREWIMSEKKGQEPQNVTDEVMQTFCAALGRSFHKSSPQAARRALKLSIEQGKTIMLQGAPGIGKTEYVKQETRETGINTQYWSLQNINPDEHVVPFPGDNSRLDLMLSKVIKPLDGKEYILIADEYYRAKPAVLNMMLEVTQGATLGGQDIPVKTVIAMTNPRMINGQRQSVNKPDRAQADRFFVSIDLTENDIPANEYLLNKYQDVAEPFLEWYKEDLDDLGRTLVNKRVLEGMMQIYEFFQDSDELQHGLPYINDEHVAVSLTDLKTRLKKGQPARLRYVLEKKDEFAERLADRAPDGGNGDQEAHITVYTAMNNAEASELEKAKDDLAELVAHMDRTHRVALVRNKGDRQSIMSKILVQASKSKKP